MMQHYYELARYERGGFDIIVDKTWEDLHPRDCFDDTCYDIEELERKVNDGIYDWFMIRVRVFFKEHEMAVNHLGGCLYERPEEILTDGTAEDMIQETLYDAQEALLQLRRELDQHFDVA